MRPTYDCTKCPAYCCTYPRTAVTDADIRRLAKGLGKPVAYVREKYTKLVEGERVLRHKIGGWAASNVVTRSRNRAAAIMWQK